MEIYTILIGKSDITNFFKSIKKRYLQFLSTVIPLLSCQLWDKSKTGGLAKLAAETDFREDQKD